MEVGVSAHFVGFYKKLFGEGINCGHYGLMGAISAALLMGDAFRKAI